MPTVDYREAHARQHVVESASGWPDVAWPASCIRPEEEHDARNVQRSPGWSRRANGWVFP